MNKIEKAITWIQSIRSRNLIIFLIILQTLVHVKYSNYPPVGYHQWRQTMGLSVARNFYEEDMNLFQPRVDSREQHTGITGMEFPIVYYSIALTYEIFGVNNITARYVILFFSFISLAFCYLFFKEMFKNKFYGLLSSLLLIFSPLFCYYSFLVLPEVPSLSFVFTSLYFFYKWENENKNKYLILALSSLCLASLVKISALIVLPYLLVRLYKKQKFNIYVIVSIIICLFIIASWYLYARFLSNYYHNYDFLLTIRLPESLSDTINALKKVFIQWLPEMYINYAEFVLFVIGLYFLFKRRKEFIELKMFFIWYGLGLAFFMVVMLPMLVIHDYYMVISLPLIIGITTLGGYHFIEYLQLNERKRFLKYLALVIAILIPVLGCIRALDRLERGIKDLSPEYLNLEKDISKVIPNKNELVIVIDESPSNLLYFAHRKGWHIKEDISLTEFSKLRKYDVRYLISDTRNFDSREEMRQFLKPVYIHDVIRVYEISK
jgi:hypothetical protein